MTVSFTRCCKKPECWISGSVSLFCGLFFICLFSTAWAISSGLNIKSAELVPLENVYALNADFEINFSKEVEEALNKGVQLDFLIEFQIVSPSKYWFDDEIKSTSMHVTMGYHALSRQYLVNRNNHQYVFANLQEAKDDLAHVRNWQVVEKSLLSKGEDYYAALRIRLDQSRLPKPLQVDALGSEDWNMVSERYRWTPNLAF